MENLVKYNSEIPAVDFQQVLNFQNLLNDTPKTEQIRVNSLANNAKYIGIADVEQKLDEMYSGLWQTDNFRWQVVANEIIGSIDLSVLHPVFKVWIKRTGSAATMILTQSGKEPIVENKIKNTLVKDFPHLKAECIKNAAKSLGVVFGRNLNRDAKTSFEDIESKSEKYQASLQTAIEYIQNDVDLSETEKENKIKLAAKQPITKLINLIKYYENKTV
jgi:hypothetical protein